MSPAIHSAEGTNSAPQSVSSYAVALDPRGITAGSEVSAVLTVSPPLAEALARGLVVIGYQASNLRISPLFGPEAARVTPRLGHLHLTLDDAPWHWVDVSGEPLIVQGLQPGSHRMLIELADPTHRVIDSKLVAFEIPKPADAVGVDASP